MKRRKKTMSNFVWSKEQELAITSTSSNVLLSAGAGSGKTAVLTERIYRLVKNGADLSRFLILTFTNAASAEMKIRIREKLMSDEKLANQLAKIETAHIETFDSFALFLVKKYSFRLGVSPNIGILDKTLLDIERNNIRDNLITYLYQERNSDFLKLISKYCVKNDNQIRSYITDLCLKAESQINKKEYLDSFIDTYFNEKRLNQIVDSKFDIMVDSINQAIKDASSLEDADDASQIIEALESLLEKGKDFNSLTTAYNEFKFPTKKKSAATDGDYRNSIKANLQKALIREIDFGTREEIIEQYMSTKEDMKTLMGIVKEIEDKLDKYKKEKSSYSFGDIAALALKALDMEDIRKQISEFFEYILVDEYQDTSMIQELVINKLERNNVCMVGDIKQSIYRFRKADCTLFQEKYIKYKDGLGGQLISLNTSYRSRREIVDVVNEMFTQLMKPVINPINYADGHNFEFGFTAYDSLIDDKENYKLKVEKYSLAENENAIEKETLKIVEDITHKIRNKYQVYDKDARGLRDCSFKDFAIIIDRGRDFDQIKAQLSDYGIPAKVIYNEPVKESEIILVLKNLLILFNACLKKEFDDKYRHAFVSISRSFISETSDQVIYNYLKENNISDSLIMRKMMKVVDSCQHLPVSKILISIINEFAIYQKINKLKHFSNNANKIELFVRLAENMDDLGMSLDGLISYLEDLNKYDLEIDYSDKDVGDNAVTIITIHRSKGLEYPIVYMPGLTSRFNSSNATSFLIDDKLGPVLPITGNNTKSSLFNHLIKNIEAKESFEERLRLFYVAVTRVRERLILFYQEKENGDSEIYSPISMNSFRSFVHFLHLEDKYGETSNYPIKTFDAEDHFSFEDLTIKHINIEPVEVFKKMASKERTSEVDNSLLEFGTEIHYLLEIVDYESKDLSFISDSRMRKYVNNVLQSEIFKNVENSQVLHEYSFFDEKNGVSGIIDCIVTREQSIDIVDFKLKNLDDEKYILQLHTYRDYIEQTTDKVINMYLISAITGEVKQIE